MTSIRSRVAIAAMLALLLLTVAVGIWQGARAPGAGAVIPDSASTVTLAPGEEIVLADGTRVRFAGVVSDSRCPMDAMCLWMGEAVLAFEIETAAGYVGDLQVVFSGDPSIERVEIVLHDL